MYISKKMKKDKKILTYSQRSWSSSSAKCWPSLTLAIHLSKSIFDFDLVFKSLKIKYFGSKYRVFQHEKTKIERIQTWGTKLGILTVVTRRREGKRRRYQTWLWQTQTQIQALFSLLSSRQPKFCLSILVGLRVLYKYTYSSMFFVFATFPHTNTTSILTIHKSQPLHYSLTFQFQLVHLLCSYFRINLEKFI